MAQKISLKYNPMYEEFFIPILRFFIMFIALSIFLYLVLGFSPYALGGAIFVAFLISGLISIVLYLRE